MTHEHRQEVEQGNRFKFGENWARFLRTLDERKIRTAEDSLRDMLGISTLTSRSFLDVGCGSGLFSLAAKRLGARVHSLDYDPRSVACAGELKRRYFPDDSGWVIEEGSALDRAYLSKLGSFDIVYSWGVLHHTGAMWQALDNMSMLVSPGGKLFIAIYNDQGTPSKRWAKVKQFYNKLPQHLRFLVTVPCLLHLWWQPLLKDVLTGRAPGASWREYHQNRGMSPWHDVVDWVGGYPFEVAKPEGIFDFYAARGFSLRRLATCRGTLGCNEFVFQKDASAL